MCTLDISKLPHCVGCWTEPACRAAPLVWLNSTCNSPCHSSPSLHYACCCLVTVTHPPVLPPCVLLSCSAAHRSPASCRLPGSTSPPLPLPWSHKCARCTGSSTQAQHIRCTQAAAANAADAAACQRGHTVEVVHVVLHLAAARSCACTAAVLHNSLLCL